ncbi:MAG: histone deacetylase [Actinomycetota bacterium]
MLVWYAAYGSNLLRSRFVTYLRGGPVPGSGRIQAGARDDADPQEAVSYAFDRPLIFGQRASGWGGGGVCFVDPDRSEPGVTAGRAWLVTGQQLSDIWAQENGLDVGVDPDLEAVRSAGSLDVGTGWYRRLLSLGELDGHPILTFTCASPPELNPAHSSYLGVVGQGLRETWGWSPQEAAAYLAACPGNAGQVDPASLATLLEAEPPS